MSKRKKKTSRKNATQRAPVALHFGYIKHVSKRDAAAHVQGLIRRQLLAPEIAYWRIQKGADGYLYEIHEGGAGRAYLPKILAYFKKSSDAAVYLPTDGRIVKVTQEDGKIRSVVLPEQEVVELTDMTPGPKMTPFAPSALAPLITAGVFFSMMAVLFIATVLTTNSARDQWINNIDQAAQATVDNLPYSHWPNAQPPGQYVTSVRYVGNTWNEQIDDDPIEPPDDIDTRPAG